MATPCQTIQQGHNITLTFNILLTNKTKLHVHWFKISHLILLILVKYLNNRFISVVRGPQFFGTLEEYIYLHLQYMYVLCTCI